MASLSKPLMREALIGCSGGRICSLKVAAGTNSGLARISFFLVCEFINEQNNVAVVPMIL